MGIDFEDRRIRRRLALASCAILLVCALFVVAWRIVTMEHEREAGLVARAASVAEAVDRDLVAAISSDDSEIRGFALLRLHRQLTRFETAFASASIASFTTADGEVRVGPGRGFPVESATDGEAAPLVDESVSRALEPALAGARAVFVGGTPGGGPPRVAALAPVLDGAGAAPRLHIMLTVDLAAWREQRFAEIANLLLLLSPLALTVCLGFALIRIRRRRADRAAAHLRHAEGLVIGVFGVVATLIAASVLYDSDRRGHDRAFTAASRAQAIATGKSLRLLIDQKLESLASFYAASRDVTREEFSDFVASSMRSYPIAFIGWAPRVPAAGRAEFEARILAEGGAPGRDFFIADSDRDGMRAAASRQEHRPLVVVEARDGAFGYGFDLARQAGFGEPAPVGFSRAFPLSISPTDGRAILIGYRALPERAHMVGIPPTTRWIGPDGDLAIGIDLQRLIDQRVAEAAAAGNALSLAFMRIDPTAYDAPVVVGSPSAGDGDAVSAPCRDYDPGCTVFPVFVGGEAFGLVLRPAADPAHASFMNAAFPALACGLPLTLVLVLLSLFMASRREASEREKALRAAELQASEERFRTLLSSMNDLVFVFDREGRISELMQSSAAGPALDVALYRGRRVEETPISAEARAIIADALERVRRTFESVTVDFALDLPGRGQTWQSASFSPLRDPARDGEGQASGVIAVARDVTERKEAQMRAAQREKFLEHLMALSAQFVNLSGKDWDDTVDAALERVGRFCGIDRSYLFVLDPSGTSMSNTHEWVAEGIAAQREFLQNEPLAVMPNVAPMLRRRLPVVIDHIDDLPDTWSNERSVLQAQDIQSVIVMPIIEGGGVVGFVGFDSVKRARVWTDLERHLLRVFADILGGAMARRSADEALRKSELRYRGVVNRVREVIFETDREGRWTFINAAFEQLSGYDPNYALGRAFVEHLHPEDRDDVAARLTALLSGEAASVRLETRWRRGGSEYRRVEIACEAERDADGQVNGMFGTLMDITERYAARAQIERLAFYDALTDLPNRPLLLEKLGAAVARADEGEGHSALLFIDLDNFKQLNDTYGHDKGDLLLQSVARRLSARVQPHDVVARLGGDEFVVLLNGLAGGRKEALAQAETIASRLLAALNEPYDLEGHSHHVSPSMGATVFGDCGRRVETLLRHADLAMYQAKSAGRNTLRFFTPEMESAVVRRAGLEADIREAIAADQFLLHLQPQVDNFGGVIGAEALVRWMHPERGMVSPAEFIPLAEETGLIVPIGRLVVEKACAHLVEIQREPGCANLSMAVNVSARQFREPSFVADLREAVARYGLAPHTIVLELTESLFLDDMDFAVDKMNQLRAEGFRFALDDFGTGYSSLTYLKSLPFDKIKVDQAFVADIMESEQAATIVETIIRMGRALDLEVVAEGVETAGQLAWLLEAGCQHFQGYFFGRPVPVEAFMAMLANRRSYLETAAG
ncbi:MAG: EAL domain-containing protein [Salinarimonadaceae bacterium]|nr:MAG: EAL domain-containing protein [Salinarimonadaceae bacterium]